MTDKKDPIATLEQQEVAFAETCKAEAERIVAARKSLDDKMAANPPRTAVGAQAFTEVKTALAGGNAIDRIRARREAAKAA